MNGEKHLLGMFSIRKDNLQSLENFESCLDRFYFDKQGGNKKETAKNSDLVRKRVYVRGEYYQKLFSQILKREKIKKNHTIGIGDLVNQILEKETQ